MSTRDVSAALRRAADYLDELGSVYVESVVLRRDAAADGEALMLTVTFDRERMRVDLDYLDPRVAASFDASEERRADFDFMLALAAECDARTVVDLGCGTGRLARQFAAQGRRVIGVEPATAMLEVARSKPGSESVFWVLGDASALGVDQVDLVVMTGNVVLAFSDAEWDAALKAIHGVLRQGGYLAFGSWNPEVRPWKNWSAGDAEVVRVGDGFVDAVGHIRFAASGESLDASSRYRFRSGEELRASMSRAGFAIERAYGDWEGAPPSNSSPEIVLVARRT